MTRAVRLLCDWLFREGVGRLELRTHPENEPSQRLAERRASSAKGSSAGRSGCTAGGRTRSCGRCFRTTRDDAALAARPTLGVIPIRLVLGVVLLCRGEARRRSRTSALLAFVSGVVGITFLLFNDPRARFVPARPSRSRRRRTPRRAALAPGARGDAAEHGRPGRARADHARPTADADGAARRRLRRARRGRARSRCRGSIRRSTSTREARSIATVGDPRRQAARSDRGTTVRPCRTRR